MPTLSTEIILDLSCTSPRCKVYAKQGDGGTRQIWGAFKRHLTDDTYMSFGAVDHIEFNVLRPDGYVVHSTATISGDSSGNPIAVGVLTAEMLEKAGRAFGDFLLVDASGNIISAPRFVIEIGDAADSEKAIPPPTPIYLLMVFEATRPADLLTGIILGAVRPADLLMGITVTAEEAEE